MRNISRKAESKNYHKMLVISLYLKSLRPQQWYKNILVFAALFFSKNISNISAISESFFAFLVFCLVSGGVYIINDIIDYENDRVHPIKKKRPIASGKLNRSHAGIFSLLLITISLVSAFLLTLGFGIVTGSYLLLFLIYSLILKQIIILDAISIAIGFVLRAVAGAVAINVIFSPWLVICTFLLALFLVLGKRRHELVLLGDNAQNHRKILESYSVSMLEQMITITTSALIISYSMYTFLTDNQYMMLTIPFAIYGLFRYLHLVHMREFGGEPEMLFRDKPMLVNFFLWIVFVVIILYVAPPAGIL